MGGSPRGGHRPGKVVLEGEELAHQHFGDSGSPLGPKLLDFQTTGMSCGGQSDSATTVAYINHQGGTRSQTAQKEVDRMLT